MLGFEGCVGVCGQRTFGERGSKRRKVKAGR